MMKALQQSFCTNELFSSTTTTHATAYQSLGAFFDPNSRSCSSLAGPGLHQRNLRLNSAAGDRRSRDEEMTGGAAMPDDLDKVQELDLSLRRLAKVMNLEAFEGLQRLSLSSNRLRDIEGIFHMKALTVLDLSFNMIKTVPKELADLKHLKDLSLHGNLLENVEHIDLCEGLEMLNIGKRTGTDSNAQEARCNTRGGSFHLFSQSSFPFFVTVFVFFSSSLLLRFFSSFFVSLSVHLLFLLRPDKTQDSSSIIMILFPVPCDQIAPTNVFNTFLLDADSTRCFLSRCPPHATATTPTA